MAKVDDLLQGKVRDSTLMLIAKIQHKIRDRSAIIAHASILAAVDWKGQNAGRPRGLVTALLASAFFGALRYANIAAAIWLRDTGVIICCLGE